MNKTLITKEMKIEDVIKKYPETVGVFVRFGFHCVGCVIANLESIEDGAKAHGIIAEELVKELNEAIEK